MTTPAIVVPKTENRKFRQAQEWVQDNPVVAISSISLAIAGIRLLAVSGGNTQVLQTLVQTLDIPALVTATLLPIVPNIIVIVYLMYWDNQFTKPKDERTKHSDWVIYSSILIVGTLLFLVPIILLASYILFFIFIQIKRYGARRQGMTLSGVSFQMIIIPPILIAISSNSSLWLPPETITFDTAKQQTAYVLASDVRWTTLLLSEKSVAVVPSSKITARDSCALSSSNDIFYKSLISFNKNSKTDPPKCIEENSERKADEGEAVNSDALKLGIAAIVLAILAIILAYLAWTRSGTVDERDKKAWRLTRIQEDVAVLLQLSENRYEMCKTATKESTGGSPEKMKNLLNEMAILDTRIKSANDGEITLYAHSIVTDHQSSENALERISNGYIETSRGLKTQTLSDAELSKNRVNAMMSKERLDVLHAALIMSTRNELGLKPNSENLIADVKPAKKDDDSNNSVAKSDQA